MADSGDTLKLLIVEDSLNDAEVLVSELRNAGYAVRPQRVDEEDALVTALAQHKPDLVLCSTSAEDVDIATALRHIGQSGRDIPLIAVAGSLDDGLRIEAMRSGARDLVTREHVEHLRLTVIREVETLRLRQQLRRQERALRESERRCHTLLDSSREAIAYVHEGMHIYANPTYLSLFGFDDFEEIEGTPIMDMVAPDDHAAFKNFLRNYSKKAEESGELEVHCVGPDGNNFKALMEFTPATVDGEACTQIVIRNRADTAELEQKLMALSSQDLLTGLYNRQYFIDTLDNTMKTAEEQGELIAVLYVEVDNVRNLKDTVGLAACDLIYGDIGNILREHVTDRDLLARFGDNVFTIQSRGRDLEALKALAETIRKAVEEHVVDLGGRSASVTCSIGIGQADDQTISGHDVLARADAASHKARTEGGNRVRIYQRAVVQAPEKDWDTNWEERVSAAVEAGRFKLLYQPIVNLHGDPAENYEVLVRMLDENGEEIPPSRFIPVAEQTGLITAIDRWVIGEAIKVLSERNRAGYQTHFFIKISSPSLEDENLVPWVAQLMKETRLQGDRLVFEIAEMIAVTRLKEAKVFAKAVKALHCGFALDHFGAGLNSFHLLKHLPADVLKIDGSFMKDLATNKENQDQVKSITEQAQDLGKLTIAEFVEDAQSLAVLWQCGVNYIQGYFLQEPSETLSYDFAGESM